MTGTRKAYVCALAAVACWSTVATAFKLALGPMKPIELLFYASVSSATVLALVAVGQGKVRLVLDQSRGDWLRSAGLGLLNPLAYYLVLFEAYSRLEAQEAQPLNYTWPLVLSLLSVPLLKQKLRARMVVALVVSFSGVVVIATRGDLRSFSLKDPLGYGLAVGSSIIWALFWILSLKDRRDATVKLLMSSMFGALYVIPLLAAVHGFRALPAGNVAAAVYAGFFEMGITFVLWLSALGLARNSASVSNLAYLSPFVSLVWIQFVLGEEIRLSSVFGLALIVGGILIQVSWSREPDHASGRGEPGASAPG